MLIPGRFLVLISLMIVITIIAIIEGYGSHTSSIFAYIRSFKKTKVFTSLAMCGISVFALFRNLLYSKFTFWGETIELRLRATDIISAIFKRPSENLEKVLDTFDLEFADLIQELPQKIKTYALLFGVLILLLIISTMIHFFQAFDPSLSENSSKKAHVFSLITLAAYWLFSLVLRKETQVLADEFAHKLTIGSLGLVNIEIPVETHTFLPVLLGAIVLVAVIYLNSDSFRIALQRTPSVNPTTTKEQDNIALLTQYKKLLDDGVITEEEFQQKSPSFSNKAR